MEQEINNPEPLPEGLSAVENPLREKKKRKKKDMEGIDGEKLKKKKFKKEKDGKSRILL